jgi:hypothetical protein
MNVNAQGTVLRAQRGMSLALSSAPCALSNLT